MFRIGCWSRSHVCGVAFMAVMLFFAGCGGNPAAPMAAAEPAPERVVFVSSTVFTGDFGGAAAADGVCSALARAAGLSGAYRAWLSDDQGHSPSTRFSHTQLPFVMTSGVRVADHWSDLTDGTINNPIVVDEWGEQPGTVPIVWTGTTASGQPFGETLACDGWADGSADAAGQVGEFDAIDHRWSASRSVGCDQLGRFYCFEQ